MLHFQWDYRVGFPVSMKKLWFVVAALLILIPLGLWWFSTEQVIMRRTHHLMEVLTISAGSGGPIREAKVISMNSMLAPEVELESPDIADANGSFDNQELESAFSWVCQNAKRSRMHVTNFRKIAIDDDGVEVIADVKGYLELASSRPADGNFLVKIHWVKVEDGWRFDKMVWKNF